MIKLLYAILLSLLIPVSAAADSKVTGSGNYYFTADWCPGCKTQSKIIKVLEEMGYEFTIYDTDRDRDAFRDFNIKTIPTIVLIRGKAQPIILTGQQPAKLLAKLLAELPPIEGEANGGPEPIKKIITKGKDLIIKLKDKLPVCELIEQLLNGIRNILKEDNTK